MHFDRSELQQLTPEYINTLSPARLVTLCEQLRQDLITARDRLNQNPSNSSRPSSTLAPWDRQSKNKDFEDDQDPNEILSSPEDPSKGVSDDDSDDDDSNPASPDTPSHPNDSKGGSGSPKNPAGKKRKPGKQPGAKGFGRTQKLIVTKTVILKPECCKGCAKKFETDAIFQATGGYCTIDISPPESGKIGLSGSCIKYIFGTILCDCGFTTTNTPYRAEKEAGWTVEMGEWRLIKGILMTDGYNAYRWYKDRLRCWSHLKRKGKALEESFDSDANSFGCYVVKAFTSMQESIYKMRAMKPEDRAGEATASDTVRIELLMECLKQRDAKNEKVRAFAGEVINDNQVIFRILKQPDCPLTNNAAEQALRPMVILRKISYGSKTEEGSHSIAILASVTETIRVRGHVVWSYFSGLFKTRRSGNSPPSLPPILVSS